MFIVYVNDLPDVLRMTSHRCVPTIYGDDTNAVVKLSHPEYSECGAQEISVPINRWCFNDNSILNIENTECMIFHADSYCRIFHRISISIIVPFLSGFLLNFQVYLSTLIIH